MKLVPSSTEMYAIVNPPRAPAILINGVNIGIRFRIKITTLKTMVSTADGIAPANALVIDVLNVSPLTLPHF